jgi:molecular chaperone GrpE
MSDMSDEIENDNDNDKPDPSGDDGNGGDGNGNGGGDQATGQDAEAAPESDEAPSDGEATAEETIADLKDKLLRTLAENENVLRRAKREREETSKYAIANFARDMLGAADNLRRALDAIPEGSPGDADSTAALIEGVQLTERGLLSIFERYGITKIEPMGAKFDHDFHEAIFEVPTADAEPGTVVQVVEAGYLIHDRLLRAARVGIAKALPEDGDERVLDTTA